MPDEPLSFEDEFDEFDDEGDDEPEPLESDELPELEVAVGVPVLVSWSARPATATTPTSETPASPAVIVRAPVSPRSRCTGASRCPHCLTPMLAAESDETVCTTYEIAVSLGPGGRVASGRRITCVDPMCFL